MAEMPPYTCEPGQPVIPAIEVFNADGSWLNTMICSECDIRWYCEYQASIGNPGCTWRLRFDCAPDFPDVIGTAPPAPPPEPVPEPPPAEPDPDPEPAPSAP